MAERSPQKPTDKKKAAKSLKEKRSDKKAKQAERGKRTIS